MKQRKENVLERMSKRDIKKLGKKLKTKKGWIV